MKITNTIGLLLVLLVIPLGVLAQHSVSGTVTDASNGETLPGVNVLVSGTNIGAATDAEGNYSIDAPSGQDTLRFSFVGYQATEVPIDGRNTISIALSPEAIGGEEVVVIGYGTTTREDVTGSISSVSSEDWEEALINNTDQILQGRSAGVRVSTSSHEPGGAINVNIRGIASLSASGSPLYVIDGIPISRDVETGQGDGGTSGSAPSPLNSIDPSAISNIEVLKGPSATAIYGSRAANGVVLISTKEGISGVQSISFETSVGVQQVLKKFDTMTASEWAIQANERAEQLGQPVQPYTDQQLQELGVGANWQDVVFRNALQQKYTLSFSGGTDQFRYNVTGNHSGNEGIVRGSSYKRYGSTIRVDANPHDRVSIGGSLMLTADENNKLRTDTKGYEGWSNIIDAVLEAPPTIPARDENGKPTNLNNYTLGGGKQNPLVMTDEYHQTGNTFRILNSFNLTYDITNSLSFDTRFGADIYDFRWNQYVPIGSEASSGAGGVAYQEDARTINVLTENILRFKQDFTEDHSLDALVGFTYQQEKSEALDAEVSGFSSNFFQYNNMSSASTLRGIDSDASRWQLISYLGRANYSYKDKYLLTSSVRVDGSSKFGRNNKYGVFPSAAIAWKLGNEQFIQDLDLFSQLKLRLEWGRTGNEGIGTYSSLATIDIDFGRRGAYIFNQTVVPEAEPSGVPNPDLGWEKTSEWTVGLDAGFLENALVFNANYFHKKTTDLLLGLPIPSQSGFGGVLTNAGSLENKGFEFEVHSSITSQNFNWNSDLNFSLIRNKVTSLAGAGVIWSGWVGGGNVSTHNKFTARTVPGGPIGRFYGSIYMGTWESQEQIDQVGTMPGAAPGEPRYMDVDEDGTYNANDDDVFLGNPNPDFSYGFRNSFNYKNWNLEMFLYGEYGSDVLNLTSQFHTWNGLGIHANRLNRWTPDNRTSDIPAARSSAPQRVSSQMVEDGSFLRIQNVSLAYNLPVQEWQIGLRGARIGVSVDNLAVLTGYSGYDPEVNAYGSSNTTQKLDRFPYPSARTFRVKASLDF